MSVQFDVLPSENCSSTVDTHPLIVYTPWFERTSDDRGLLYDCTGECLVETFVNRNCSINFEIQDVVTEQLYEICYTTDSYTIGKPIFLNNYINMVSYITHDAVLPSGQTKTLEVRNLFFFSCNAYV